MCQVFINLTTLREQLLHFFSSELKGLVQGHMDSQCRARREPSPEMDPRAYVFSMDCAVEAGCFLHQGLFPHYNMRI